MVHTFICQTCSSEKISALQSCGSFCATFQNQNIDTQSNFHLSYVYFQFVFSTKGYTRDKRFYNGLKHIEPNKAADIEKYVDYLKF